MLKDMMPHFDLYQPDTVEAAVDLAARLGSDGWLLGAGQDSYDWFKNRTKRTPAVIEKVGAALPRGFPAQIADTILAGVRASAERLSAESPAYPPDSDSGTANEASV